MWPNLRPLTSALALARVMVLFREEWSEESGGSENPLPECLRDVSSVEAALVHLEHVPRHLADTQADPPPVQGFERECLQDQELEGALEQFGLVVCHTPPLGGLQK